MSWAQAEERFATKFQGYESRPPQRSLATTIEQALEEGAHLAAQAPCGTGKSYAAQVTAIDYAKYTGRPVVLATATKALQDQYIRDAEDLQELYEPFRFAVVKGRSNYVCLAKLDELTKPTLGFPAELAPLFPMIQHGGTTINGESAPIAPFVPSKPGDHY